MDEGFTRLEEYADDEQVVAAVDTALRRVLELKAMFGLLPEDGADTAAIAMPSADASRRPLRMGVSRPSAWPARR